MQYHRCIWECKSIVVVVVVVVVGVLLSEAPSCDGLPEEIWCSQQMFEGLYEVWALNFRGNPSHIGSETEGLYCFYYIALTTNANNENCQKRALCADRRPLRRDIRVTWSISTNGSTPKSSVVLYNTIITKNKTKKTVLATRPCKDWSNDVKKALPEGNAVLHTTPQSTRPGMISSHD